MGERIWATSQPHGFAPHVRRDAGTSMDYRKRFRDGDRISSKIAGRTVNTLVRKHFTKRQELRWSRYIAHFLLQTHTYALDIRTGPCSKCGSQGLSTTIQPA